MHYKKLLTRIFAVTERRQDYGRPAMPLAPVREPVTKPRPTTTPKPTTPPKPAPSPLFPGVAPGTKPKPRAVAKGYHYITESYEEFVNPDTQKLFSQGHDKLGFSRHPMMRKYGNNIARAAYEHSNAKLYATMGELQNLDANRRKQRLAALTGNAIGLMMQIERAHKEELEQLAVDAVAKVYNLPENEKHRLRAYLRYPQKITEEEINEVQEPNDITDDDREPDDISDDDDIDFESAMADQETYEQSQRPVEIGDTTDEVHKRYALNLLSQGAAIHAMHDLHLEEELMNKLSAIDERLPDLYSKFGRGSSHQYWLHNINQALGYRFGDSGPEGAMGTAQFDYQGNIHAQAPVFTVLVQELVKGLMMLLSHHQFSEMPSHRARAIMDQADTIADEFPQIMVGPKIWTAFILALPKEYKSRVMEVVMQLAKAHPKELHEIMMRLGHCVANKEDPRESAVASALRDLLDRTLKVETPEDVAGFLDDENDFGTGESDEEDYR